MSIDPLRLVQQQRAMEAKEYRCPGCGVRTRTKMGRCSTCHKVGGGVNLERLSPDQFAELVKAVKAEAVRREKVLRQAMEGVR